MTDSNHEVDLLFGRARAALGPSPGERERLRARLGLRIGVAGGAAVAVAAAAASRSGAPTAARPAAIGAVKLATSLTLVLVLAVGAGTLLVRGAPSRAPSSHPHTWARGVGGVPQVTGGSGGVPEVTSALAGANQDVAESTAAPEATPVVGNAMPRAPGRASAFASPPHRADDAFEEIALLAKIQAALRVDDTPLALSLVDEHARRFPNGALAPEREGARVLARCSRSATPQRQALGRVYLEDHPRSPLAARVRAACALEGD
jgi:hypothetical protein